MRLFSKFRRGHTTEARREHSNLIAKHFTAGNRFLVKCAFAIL